MVLIVKRAGIERSVEFLKKTLSKEKQTFTRESSSLIPNFTQNRPIGHFRVTLHLCFKTSLRAKPFIRKWVSPTGPFSCMPNLTHCHLNGFARRLVLKQRQRVTRKWPIRTFNCTVTLVFRGFSVLTSLFFSGSLMVTFNGGLSAPRRSKTDCLFITLALFTAMKIQTIKPDKMVSSSRTNLQVPNDAFFSFKPNTRCKG